MISVAATHLRRLSEISLKKNMNRSCKTDLRHAAEREREREREKGGAFVFKNILDSSNGRRHLAEITLDDLQRTKVALASEILWRMTYLIG